MSAPHLDSHAIQAIRRALLAFFDTSARDLPWRRSGDPYAIWISEVMAQQTRLETVIPYWERWLQRFPDVQALAAAPVDDVLKQWEGLGYYSRARNLHAAARIVAERHGGSLPGDYAALRALPGIGEYTAGAVSSIAFDVPSAAVDGNVRRVLARLLDEPAPTQSRLRDVAGSLVPDERPGDFNQSLMELGALICTPRAPRCTECPLRSHCAASAAGTQHDRPRMVPKRVPPMYEIVTAVLRAPDGRVLVVRRPATGLLAGLWSFPGRELPHAPAAPAEAARLAAGLARELVGSAVASEPVHIGIVAHTFSHRREVYHCHLVGVASQALSQPSRPSPAAERAWIGSSRGDLTLPRAQQKVHELVHSARLEAASGA
jgi:A/G-specific adenine glycosylase